MLLGTSVNQQTYAFETRQHPYAPSKPPTFPDVLPITPETTAELLAAICSSIKEQGIPEWTLPKKSPVLAVTKLASNAGLYFPNSNADGQAKKATAGSKKRAFYDIVRA